MEMEEGRRQRRDGAEPRTGLIPGAAAPGLFPAMSEAAPSSGDPPQLRAHVEPEQGPTALGCSCPALWDPPNPPCPRALDPAHPERPRVQHSHTLG